MLITNLITSSGNAIHEEEANLAAEMLCQNSYKLVAIVLLIGGSANAFLLREEYVVRSHHYVIADGDPCQFILDETMKRELAIQLLARRERKPIPCKAPILIEFEYCRLKAQRLRSLLNELPRVVTVVKRSVLVEMARQASRLATRIGAGATIFLKGIIKKVLDDTAVTASKQLLNSLLQIGEQQYINQTIIPPTLARDEIGVVSVFARERPDQLDLVVNNLNY